MKTLYQAANSLEAHMIVHMLEQQGITARVDGEYLQGGVGELPAAGLVRVMVDEEDYAAAKAIVERWDAVQPALAPHAAARPAGRFGVFMLGAALGALAVLALYQAPVANGDISLERDGRADHGPAYSDGARLLKNELDRNADGRLDYIAKISADGVIVGSARDDDFDGVFESVTTYRRGNPHVSETDTDHDGYHDLRTNFIHGVPRSVEYIDPARGRPRRIEFLQLGRVTHAEIDGDADGKMDRRLQYNAAGEVVATENLK